MVMTLPNNGAVVVDANILIAICAKETGTHLTAETAFTTYSANGWEFFASSVIVAEGFRQESKSFVRLCFPFRVHA